MTTPDCEHLEAYLGGWLLEPQRCAFEVHLRDCATCQAEVSKQERVDRLLAEARTYLERVPPSLTSRIARQLESSAPTRRVHWVAWGLPAAAAVLLVVVMRPVPEQQVPHGRDVASTTEFPGQSEEDGCPVIETRQAALRELAMLITSQTEHASTSAHPWLRMATIAAPREREPPRRSTRRPRVHDDRASASEDGQGVKITRGLPPFDARAIQWRRTLGQRKLSDTLPVPPEVYEHSRPNGSDI